MSLTVDSTASSTIGWPVGVSLQGFHPKSIRYSPICCLEPRLNGFKALRMKGVLSPDCCTFWYSSSVSPTLDRLPSFLVFGTTCLTSTHLGLNTLCTSSSTTSLRSFRVASKSIACLMSKSQPLRICSCVIHCTSCSRSMDSWLNLRSSIFILLYALAVTRTSWIQ